MKVKAPPRSRGGYPQGRPRPIKKSEGVHTLTPAMKALYHKRALVVVDLKREELIDLYLACVEALAGSPDRSEE